MTPSDYILTKKQQRALALQRRRALSDSERQQASAGICEKLKRLPELRTVRTIFSYMAVPEEADPAGFDRWVAAQGIQIAYPVSYAGGIMEARVPEDSDSYTVGAYGIRAPDPARSRLLFPSEIDMIIVPCVAFDAQGGRCGHGAGYYDRYLPLCPEALTVMIAFEAQRLDRLIQEPTDRQIPVIVTEESIYRI